MNGTAHRSVGSMEGKVGLVTGAGSPMGIGRSLVIKLVESGAAAVYACDLNMGSIASLQEECKVIRSDSVVEGRVLDVSSEQQTLAVLKDITRRHGRFDFYFANAGFANYRNLHDTEVAHYDRQINVMQRGVFLAIKFGSQAMMVTSQEKAQPGGAIVVTGSCAGFLGSYSDLPYAVAKTALHGMVSSASFQLSASNIRVNGVAPGFTKTSIIVLSQDAEKGQYTNTLSREEVDTKRQWFVERAGLLKAPQYCYNRQADAAEIANIQVFLASDEAASINGQMILADSGKTAAAMGEACSGPIPPIQALDLS
ncbi:3-oxoacyl-reductase-like protein [Teratosphaeria nubilosa]|uniref:3-oxoacyl-reductase-like protein n=1 Tax=Teratosphaeria nubilosa TaxID=161662 RepID=A0A6G1L5R1_9PEZI|nr:3-oxoacyl-reductase-like protein [Teratosphaeria nubilosa]